MHLKLLNDPEKLYDGPFRIYFTVVECYWNGCLLLRKVSSNH